MTKRRVAPVLGACALMAAGIGASAFTSAPAADAATCASTGGTVGAGVTGCTIVGTATLGSGTLTLTPPASLAWAHTLNGLDTQVVDVNTADQHYLVKDATGSNVGWNVTAVGTQFTTGVTTTPTQTLLGTGTFATNGSLTEAAAGTLDSTTPTTACLVVNSVPTTCTAPTNNLTYPVAIDTTGTTPIRIYNAAVNTGLGSNVIGGGANPVGWWVNVPSNTLPGVYTSTITMAIITAP